MQPGHGSIQPRLAALKLSGSYLFLGGVLNGPGQTVTVKNSIFRLPLSSAGSAFLPGVMTYRIPCSAPE